MTGFRDVACDKDGWSGACKSCLTNVRESVYTRSGCKDGYNGCRLTPAVAWCLGRATVKTMRVEVGVAQQTGSRASTAAKAIT